MEEVGNGRSNGRRNILLQSVSKGAVGVLSEIVKRELCSEFNFVAKINTKPPFLVQTEENIRKDANTLSTNKHLCSILTRTDSSEGEKFMKFACKPHIFTEIFKENIFNEFSNVKKESTNFFSAKKEHEIADGENIFRLITKMLSHVDEAFTPAMEFLFELIGRSKCFDESNGWKEKRDGKRKNKILTKKLANGHEEGERVKRHTHRSKNGSKTDVGMSALFILLLISSAFRLARAAVITITAAPGATATITASKQHRPSTELLIGLILMTIFAILLSMGLCSGFFQQFVLLS